MKDSADVGVHRVVPIDVAEIDHLLFEVDGVAGQRLFRRLDLDLAQCAGLRLRRRQMRGIGRRHLDRGRVENGRKRLDVEGAIAGRVCIGDVAGDRRLARRQPLRLLRSDFEEVDRGQLDATPVGRLDRPCAARLAWGLPRDLTSGTPVARCRGPRKGVPPWPIRPGPARRTGCR